MEDKRNFLYKEMLRVISDKKPKFFVAENVKGLLSMEKGKKYYEIDLSKFQNITLKYGHGNINDMDIYVVNGDTLDVYYYKGVEYKGNTYYTYDYAKEL